MENSKINISVVVPAHNEEGNLIELIEKLYKSFSKSQFSNQYEIIIINDGSEDNTEEVVSKQLDSYENLILINLKENINKAYSLDTGIHNAKGNIIATIDADLQYSTDDLVKMLDVVYKGNDMVNGKRSVRKDIFLTSFFSALYNFILRFFFRIQLRDFFSGIKVFKKEIYNLMEYSGLARFIIFFSKKYNFKIAEMDVSHFERKRGKTTWSFFDRFILAIKDIFTLVICIALERKGLYQIKQFILSIYFLITVGLILGKLYTNTLSYDYLYYLIATFFMLSILNLIIQSFLKSKEKNYFDLTKNIKSIKKSKT